MKTIDKLSILQALPEQETKITAIGNQSFKTSLDCGCFFVQHAYAGKQSITLESSPPTIIDRFFFVELCKTHKP